MTELAALAVDYGSTISLDTIDHELGQKPVDPMAADALRTFHDDLGLKVILASNTTPHETRWPALQAAGIHEMISIALLSYPLGVSKPHPIFYQLVLAAAGCLPEQILFVGDNIDHDVAGPISHGMRAALVRPDGLSAGEELPDGSLLVRHIRELPALVKNGPWNGDE